MEYSVNCISETATESDSQPIVRRRPILSAESPTKFTPDPVLNVTPKIKFNNRSKCSDIQTKQDLKSVRKLDGSRCVSATIVKLHEKPHDDGQLSTEVGEEAHLVNVKTCKAIGSTCITDNDSTDLSVTHLNSTLNIQQKLLTAKLSDLDLSRQLENELQSGSLQSKLTEKVSNKVNVTPERQLYKNLLPVNCNEEDVEQVVRSSKPTLTGRKDAEPKFKDSSLDHLFPSNDGNPIVNCFKCFPVTDVYSPEVGAGSNDTLNLHRKICKWNDLIGN